MPTRSSSTSRIPSSARRRSLKTQRGKPQRRSSRVPGAASTTFVLEASLFLERELALSAVLPRSTQHANTSAVPEALDVLRGAAVPTGVVLFAVVRIRLGRRRVGAARAPNGRL